MVNMAPILASWMGKSWLTKGTRSWSKDKVKVRKT
jgi:hypothetical protein